MMAVRRSSSASTYSTVFIRSSSVFFSAHGACTSMYLLPACRGVFRVWMGGSVGG